MVLKRLLEKYRMPYIRVICFLVIFFMLASTAQYYLQYRERYNDNSSFQIINFYKEDKNSMDAVFIGSSITFSYYSPLFAYNSYGLKTTNYSSSGMGMLAYRYAIEEVRKYQKDALIVLTITPNYEMQYLGVHFMSDYMPMSKNKIAFLTRYFTQEGESILNSISFYATIMEYHDRWAEMDADDFIIDEGIKGATRHHYYLSTVNDISENHYVSEEKQEMPKKMNYFMSDLLDYCDEKGEHNIVFLLPPKSYSEDEYKQFNSLSELISSRGYEVLDLRDSHEQIGLFMDQDYYDINHTNIHGSIKYTDYMARYVMEKRECSLSDDPEWDKALDKYKQIIDEYILDFELNHELRDYHLERPENLSVQRKDGKNIISWNVCDDADSYYVYRREDKGFIRISDEITGNEFEDNSAEKGKTYTYTVVSCRKDGGITLFGNYDHKGISIEVNE